MARIPIYQEQESLAQNVAIKELRAPDMGARFIGQGVSQMGKALGDVAQTMMSIEDERAKTWAADTASKAREEWQQRIKTMQETDTEGGANFTAKVAKEFDAWSEQTMKSAPNGVSQNFLRTSLRALNDSVKTSALQYEVTEGRNFRIGQMKNSITTDARVLGNNPDPVLAAQIIGEKDAAIDSLAITATQKQELKQLARLTIGKVGIEAMVRTQPGVVLAQMDQARRDKSKSSGNPFLDMLPATEWDTHYNAASNSTNNLQVMQKVDEVWARLGPTSDTSVISVDVLDAEARKMFPDSPAQAKMMSAALIDRAQLAEKGRIARNNAREGAIWKAAAEGKSIAEIMAMPEMRQMDTMAQAKTISEIQKHRSSNVVTTEQNAEYLKLMSNPQELAEMKNDDFNKKLALVGPTRFKELQEKRSFLQSNPAKLSEAKIDNDDFAKVAAMAGFNPKGKDQVTIDRLAAMRSDIERRLGNEQLVKKRELTREEKFKLTKDYIASQTVFLDEWGTDPAIPYGALRQADINAAYLTVNGKNFYLGKADTAKIEKIQEAWGVANNRPGSMMPLKTLVEDYVARYGHPK